MDASTQGAREPWYTRVLPFATAPTIIRANHKDASFVHDLEGRLGELMREFKGSRYVHENREKLNTYAKLIYLLLTTGVGARTLGEEYVDIRYVDAAGRRRIGIGKRLMFIIAHVLFPLVVRRIVKMLQRVVDRGGDEVGTSSSSSSMRNILRKILDKLTFINIVDLTNLHVALFYFSGKYYELTKRIFGMRYVLGYKADPRSRQANGNYELIGGLMLLQVLFRYGYSAKTWIDDVLEEEAKREREGERKRHKAIDYEGNAKGGEDVNDSDSDGNGDSDSDNDNVADLVRGVPVFDPETTKPIVDLADENQLPYIPAQSRACMLCLDPMKDPSAGGCGHVFCWGCVLEWCQDRRECPLCRAPLRVSQLLPLR